MDIAKSNIVRSVAGRDAGSYFFVLATEEDFLLLADGKRRRIAVSYTHLTLPTNREV